jgi:hypothetical protein
MNLIFEPTSPRLPLPAQVTHHGIRALLDACPHMQHVNIGKCRQVQVERLLPGPRVRLSACHYLSA